MSKVSLVPERHIDQERALMMALKLSPAQAGVLSCLMRCVSATIEDLNEYTGLSHSKVFVSKARQKLKPHGIDIEVKPEIGYWLEPASKEILTDMLKPYMGE